MVNNHDHIIKHTIHENRQTYHREEVFLWQNQILFEKIALNV